MLEQFTWQQFFVAISVLTLIWYAGVILLFYRQELKTFFTGRPVKDIPDVPLPHRWEEKFDELEQEAEDHLMGKSKLPEGVSVISMEDIQFADGKTERLGLVSDVLEEIKTIFRFLVQEDGSKQDFLIMMAAVKADYPGIISSPNLPQINEFIVSNASFHLSNEELENLWY